VPNYSVYSAAKAGLDMLTRCWAIELAPARIRVNAILPGIVRTPVFDTMLPKDAIDGHLARFEKLTPLGRIGEPEDVARLALFLSSPASEWTTGAVIPLDGGLSLVSEA
jgi:NAD(P)-dependent dehydrogenase (short-subunit alcohol dehydrogenase family)